jgi:SAM-dependent methyltransferase
MKYGAGSGVAIDVDERSLQTARRNLAPFHTVIVRYCSIYDIPYEREFDIAFSFGVIHHLDDPDLAIDQLVKATKPGGKVLIWVYGSEGLGAMLRILNPLRIHVFSRLPLSLLRLMAWVPALGVWVVAKSGASTLRYLQLLKNFPLRHVHHIVFDQMLPRTSNYLTEDAARALLERAGLENVVVRNVNDVSWCVLGERSSLGQKSSAEKVQWRQDS